MDVNVNSNVTGTSGTTGNAYKSYETKKTTANESAEKSASASNPAAVYKPGSDSVDRTAVVAKLKADADARTAQFRSLVQSLISKQGGKANNLAELFKNMTADAETIAKAKEEVSETGYWGVNQTSDRIFEFAKALSGGDKAKMNDMLEAFKKGFKQAEKAWGEKLPELSRNTYDAVIKKFEDYQAEA